MTEYNPAKNYTWKSEDIFTMNGQEFGIILNTFREVLLTQEAKKILLIKQANDLAEQVLARAVSAGIAKEETVNPPQAIIEPKLKKT